MMGIELGEIIYKVVCGIHGGKNSEQAAGVANPREWFHYGNPTKALYMVFDIRVHAYASALGKQFKDADASCSLHYLFNRPYGSVGFATTHTFAAVMDSPFAKLSDVKQWEFLSSHDSCWRDSARQKAWEVEREMYEIVTHRAGIKDEDRIPHDRLSWHVTFPLFSDSFYQWVDVQIDKDETDKHGYDKLVKVLKGNKSVQAEGSAA